jgi:hypothetical protein
VSDLNFLCRFHKLEELHVLGTGIHDRALVQFKIKFTKERMVFNRRISMRVKPLRVDVHPEISDPLCKTLEEYRDYNPELALEAGEKLLQNGIKRRDHRKILEDMIQICKAKSIEFMNINKAKFHFFSDYQNRLQYMIWSKEFIQLKSVKDAVNIKREIQEAIRDIYLNKRSYDAFLSNGIKDNAFTRIDEFLTPISKTRFHDITIEDIKGAIFHSDIFEYAMNDDESMSIKLKRRKRRSEKEAEQAEVKHTQNLKVIHENRND